MSLTVCGSHGLLTSIYPGISIVEVWGSSSSTEKGCMLKSVESGSTETVFELATQLGIGNLEKFLRVCIANATVMSDPLGSGGRSEKLKYTVTEVAELLGVSPRWLGDQCRAERVEHIHLARRRFFSHDQILRLLEKHAVEPFDDRPVDPRIARTIRRIQLDTGQQASKASRR